MSPRNSEQNQQIRDERREQILKAAVQVFARRGLTGTKISDIAQVAGLSHGLVYHYFDSKDEIFTALVDRALEGANHVLSNASRFPGSPWQQLRWIPESIFSEDHEESAFYYHVMLQAFISDTVPEAVKERMAQFQQVHMPEYVVPLISAGQRAGLIVQDDPSRLANAFFAFLQGAILSRFQADGIGSQVDADMLMRFLKP